MFKWIPAMRTHTRGRASGGCYFGYKKKLTSLKCEFRTHNDITFVNLEINTKRLWILPLYLNCNNWEDDFERATEILNYMRSSNVMLIGDLNARIGVEAGVMNDVNGICRQSKDIICNARGKKLIELCDSFGLRIQNGTSSSDALGNFTFVGGQGSSMIDYAILGEDWEPFVTDLEIKEFPYSDHLPVVVTFQRLMQPNVESVNMQVLSRLNWKISKAPAYRQQLDLKLQEHQNVDFPMLEQIIKTSYPQQRTSRKGCKSGNEPWFDEECQKARKLSFAWLRIFRSSSQGSFRRNYMEANTKYKELCKIKKRKYEELQASRLATCKNATDFWNLAWELNGKRSAIPKKLCTSILFTHFNELLNPETTPTNWQYAIPRFSNEILDSEFTLQELEQTLWTLKDGKAAGVNGIQVEFYKYGTVLLKEHLVALFNQVIGGHLVADEFRDAIIFPIHKKGSLLDATNYRGISFLNATYKIFTTMLHKRLTMWIATQNVLKEFQAGFRSGYSTVDNIFILRSLAESFSMQGRKLYVFFIDFKAAFDTINRGALFYKLYGLGLSLKFGRVLEELYRGTQAAVWNGAELSDWFVTTSGVRQGCTLSPTLFSLFINDLIDYLPGGVDFAGVRIKALLFADDIVMFAYSPEALQLMINRVYQYCCLWNLIVNIQKSKVMIFKKGGGRNASNEKWTFNGENIECVSDYKYLGVIFSRNLSMEKHLNEKLQKAKTAINISWKRVFMNVNVAHSSKYKVFEAVAESILLYGAQVWGCKKFLTVEKLLTHYIKKIFRLPTNTPNYVLMLETGLSPLYVKTLKMQADFLLNVFMMPESRLVRKVVLKAVQDQNSWYREWTCLAEGCNVVFNLNFANISSCKALMYDVISKIDEKCREEYVAEASDSLFRTTYSRLNHNLAERNYFRDANKVYVIATMVRLRSELLNLNFIPHRPDLPLECSICNLEEREDVVHFVGRCPTLRETRRSILGSDFLSEEEVLTSLNEMDVAKLYNYCKIALRYRSRIMNGDF